MSTPTLFGRGWGRQNVEVKSFKMHRKCQIRVASHATPVQMLTKTVSTVCLPQPSSGGAGVDKAWKPHGWGWGRHKVDTKLVKRHRKRPMLVATHATPVQKCTKSITMCCPDAWVAWVACALHVRVLHMYGRRLARVPWANRRTPCANDLGHAPGHLSSGLQSGAQLRPVANDFGQI